MFDCASEAVIQGWTKQHSRSISLLGAKQARIDLETLKAEILTLRSVDAATPAQVSDRQRENKALSEAHVHASSEQLTQKEDELHRGRPAPRFRDAHVRTPDQTALEAHLSRVKQPRIGVNKKRGVECRGGRPQH